MASHSSNDNRQNTFQSGHMDNGLSTTVNLDSPPAYDILFPPPPYEWDSNNPPTNQPENNYNEGNQDTGGTINSPFPKIPVFEKSIRLGFVRKVYAILTAQMTIIAALIAMFMFETNVKLFSKAHPELVWIALGVLLILAVVLVFTGKFRKQSPTNYIAFIIFTLSQGFFLGSVTSLSSGNEVLIAVGICTAVCFALTIFSMQTKWNFAFAGGIFVVFTVILLSFGIVASCIPAKVLTLMYASLGAFIFSVCLLCDTKLMLDGEHVHTVSPEDYIFAALNHHVDIICGILLLSFSLLICFLILYQILTESDVFFCNTCHSQKKKTDKPDTQQVLS